MSTVVGLVKSRLRSRSCRDNSINGVDVVVNNGSGLVRHRSLRQEALADPTMDDTSVLDAMAVQPRTPNGLDSASPAEGLQSMSVAESIPPVPSLPADISSEFFPARQSSLHNQRQHASTAHRGASSQTKNDGLKLEALPENSRRRRQYTIPSSDDPPQFETGDYSQTSSQQSTKVESPDQISLHSDAGEDHMPSTLTAKIFGTIAERKRSTEFGHGKGQHSSRGASHTSKDDMGAMVPPTQSPINADRLRAMTYEGPRSPMWNDVEKPAPFQLKKTNKLDMPEHVHLPPGFELVNNEESVVDNVWHPAVEQQTVDHDKTEVVHPVVDKDVHVHHYLDYELLIAASKVLPIKHYQLNPKTGEKVEIDPPPGWQPPQSLETFIPNTSQIKGTQRHYIVNGEYPNGELEDSPPLGQQAVTTWI